MKFESGYGTPTDMALEDQLEAKLNDLIRANVRYALEYPDYKTVHLERIRVAKLAYEAELRTRLEEAQQ